MKLSKGVYFQRHGQLTALRHTPQRKDYLFNEIVFDILSIIKEQECSLTDLCRHLSLIYKIDDEQAFFNDIEQFVNELIDNEIIIDNNGSVDTDISETVREYCKENHILYSVSLELTYRCNEKCIHCYIDDEIHKKDELTFDEYKGLIDDIRSLGCMKLHLTGGEVTLRDDFFDIAQYAVQKGLCLDIYTNGYSITEEQIHRLAELNINSLSFSFYGGDAETHDSITQIKGSFERSLQSMILCKCLGIDTYIKTVVMKQNIDSYESLYLLAKRYGVNVVSSLAINQTHSGKSADKYRLLDNSLYQKAVNIGLKYQNADDLSRSVNGHTTGLCGAGIIALSVDPYGNVAPCNIYPSILGNIRQKNIKDIWNDNEFLKMLSRLRFEDVCQKCDECENIRFCSLCPGSCFNKNSGKFIPSEETCVIADATHKAINSFIS